MTAAEAQSWRHFRQIYGPFGEDRANWHNAAVQKAIWDVKPEMQEQYELKDYLLRFTVQTPEDDADTLARNLYKLIRG